MKYFSMKILWCFLLIELLEVGHSTRKGLKWVRVNVPQYRVPGEIAQLQCDYDLGNDTLYSVKWYKDYEEFYRYVPKARPKSISYEVEGVYVDMSKSDSRKVVLHSINWKTSGIYRCEVSAEAPSFASAQSEANMEVVSLPEEDPVISGVEEQYQIGDEINLNCTSGRSRPASILHWYINEQQIQKPEALILYPIENHAKDLVTNTLGLKFVLSNRHFLGGSMKVKCVASIAPVLFSEDRETVVESLPVLRDMREALLMDNMEVEQIAERLEEVEASLARLRLRPGPADQGQLRLQRLRDLLEERLQQHQQQQQQPQPQPPEIVRLYARRQLFPAVLNQENDVWEQETVVNNSPVQVNEITSTTPD